MRWINRTLALFAILTVSATAAWAQAKECTEEFKTATYSKWYDNRIEHQDVAFQAAEEYLAVCADDPSPYTAAIKKFHTAYKAATSSIQNKNQLEDANTKKNYAEVVRLGKQVLASEPDYIRAHILIAVAGYSANASGNASLMGDAAESAKKAIAMIDAGKPFAPYTSKEQALGSLNYIIGKSMLKNAPNDSIPYFLKAARLNADLRKDPLLYIDLANAYEDQRGKLSDEYKAKLGPNQIETPEAKLVLENLNQVIDRQIDAWARAASVTSNAADKQNIMTGLTDLYKYRNKTTDGLDQLVAGIQAKPIPDVPTPITTLPTPTTTPTPAPTPAAPGGNGTGSTAPSSSPKTNSGATTPNTSKPTNASTPSTTPSTGTGAKPSSTPKPKPRRSNHRVRK
ncbi:MAG TPA: hypothetical protein VJT71_09240 [Pyrinomonadaceae bacterium]|nr:hypothetical protein [Pyrinomonadaceae bacterium]